MSPQISKGQVIFLSILTVLCLQVTEVTALESEQLMFTLVAGLRKDTEWHKENILNPSFPEIILKKKLLFTLKNLHHCLLFWIDEALPSIRLDSHP